MLGEPSGAVHLREQIQRALDHAGNALLIEDLYAFVLTGAVQAWLSNDNSGIIFTEIICYPRIKAVRGIVSAGRLQAILSLIPEVAAWAMKMGCVRAEFVGRRGWSRVMARHWKTTAVMATADLRDIAK